MRDDSFEQPDAAELIAAHERALSGFAEALVLLHIDCDAPPRSALTKGAKAAGRCPLPASSLTEVFQGRRLPKLDFTVELVRQLRPGDADLLDEWRERWRSVKRAEQKAAPARRALKLRSQNGKPSASTGSSAPADVPEGHKAEVPRDAEKKNGPVEDTPQCPVCRLPALKDFAEVWACDGCGGVSRWDASRTVVLMDSSRGRTSFEANAYICATCDLLVHPFKMRGDRCPRCRTHLVSGARTRDEDTVW
ncbi:hypothetical protein [Streptomyces sp. NPDC087300]|uniref:hypothetical protein n=1 Tax=Streptomyces sp. NPDC087300 TaxID=3365780 RepID=UPI0037FD3891